MSATGSHTGGICRRPRWPGSYLLVRSRQDGTAGTGPALAWGRDGAGLGPTGRRGGRSRFGRHRFGAAAPRASERQVKAWPGGGGRAWSVPSARGAGLGPTGPRDRTRVPSFPRDLWAESRAEERARPAWLAFGQWARQRARPAPGDPALPAEQGQRSGGRCAAGPMEGDVGASHAPDGTLLEGSSGSPWGHGPGRRGRARVGRRGAIHRRFQGEGGTRNSAPAHPPAEAAGSPQVGAGSS